MHRALGGCETVGHWGGNLNRELVSILTINQVGQGGQGTSQGSEFLGSGWWRQYMYVVDDDQGNQSDDMDIFDFQGMSESYEGKYWER